MFHTHFYNLKGEFLFDWEKEWGNCSLWNSLFICLELIIVNERKAEAARRLIENAERNSNAKSRWREEEGWIIEIPRWRTIAKRSLSKCIIGLNESKRNSSCAGESSNECCTTFWNLSWIVIIIVVGFYWESIEARISFLVTNEIRACRIPTVSSTISFSSLNNLNFLNIYIFDSQMA